MESMLHDLLQEAHESLAEEANLNPTHHNFGYLVRRSAQYLAGLQKSLVMIVDGLDHVLRESDKTELVTLLRSLHPLPRGLWLVLGTRPVLPDIIEAVFHGPLPGTNRVEIKGLSRNGCRELLLSHREDIRLPDHSHTLDAIAETFFVKTEGNPLHAKYIIETLRRRLNGRQLSEFDLTQVPPYGGHITKYYQDLWQRLSPYGSQVACLLAIAGFPMKETQIVNCLSVGQSVPDVLRGVQEIIHLTKDGRQGFEIFHSSFLEFVRSTEQFMNLRPVIAEKLRDWLKEQCDADLKWAHLNRVEYLLGNRKAVLDTVSRTWVVEALCEGQPYEIIHEQLRLAIHAAMEVDDTGQALTYGLLSTYLSNAPRESESGWNKVWGLAWRLRPLDGSRFDSLEDLGFHSTTQIVEISREAENVNETAILDEAIKVLNERCSCNAPL
jgi:hypothetical protein